MPSPYDIFKGIYDIKSTTLKKLILSSETYKWPPSNTYFTIKSKSEFGEVFIATKFSRGLTKYDEFKKIWEKINNVKITDEFFTENVEYYMK